MKPPHLLLNAPFTRRAALIHSNAGPVRTITFIKPIPVLAKPQHNQDQYVLKVSHGLHLLLLPVQWAKLTELAGMTSRPRFQPNIGIILPILDISRPYCTIEPQGRYDPGEPRRAVFTILGPCPARHDTGRRQSNAYFAATRGAVGRKCKSPFRCAERPWLTAIGGACRPDFGGGSKACYAEMHSIADWSLRHARDP